MPTPGSPAMSTTDPGTMPRPKTRSSSPMPVVMAFVADAPTLVIGTAGLVGVRPVGRRPDTAAWAAVPLSAAAVSCSVPHDPHSGQRPSHLGETKPHSEHVWTGRTFFAMLLTLVSRVDIDVSLHDSAGHVPQDGSFLLSLNAMQKRKRNRPSCQSFPESLNHGLQLWQLGRFIYKEKAYLFSA